MPVDYEGEYRKAQERNLAEVASQLKQGRLDEKIDTYCKRTGFDRNDVVREIEKNDYFRSTFAIDPKKQNLYENVAAGYIESIEGVTEFDKLSTGALYVSSGGVVTKAQKKQMGSASTTKTIDFTWKFAGKRFYASHKYTEQEGGMQGSQYKDLLAFIAEANKTTLSDTYFLAIADGDFYLRNNGQVGITRIANLKREANSSKGVYACDIDELEDLMIRITGA